MNAPIHPDNGEKPSPYRKVIEESTSRVETRALTRHGIQNIRVLSETRFLHLIREMVEDSIRRRIEHGTDGVPMPPGKVVVLDPELESPAARPAADTPTVDSIRAECRAEIEAECRAELKTEFQGKWDELREKQRARIHDLEGRIERLSSLVATLEPAASKAPAATHVMVPALYPAGAAAAPTPLAPPKATPQGRQSARQLRKSLMESALDDGER